MGHIVWNHILREANQVTDFLTKNSLMKEEDYHVFYFVPDFILTDVTADRAQVCFPRAYKLLVVF